jgi:hypothetical protein
VLLHLFHCSVFKILKKSSCSQTPKKSWATLHWIIKLDHYKNLWDVLFRHNCRNADNVHCKHDFLGITILFAKFMLRTLGVLIGWQYRIPTLRPSLLFSSFQKNITMNIYRIYTWQQLQCLNPSCHGTQCHETANASYTFCIYELQTLTSCTPGL